MKLTRGYLLQMRTKKDERCHLKVYFSWFVALRATRGNCIYDL